MGRLLFGNDIMNKLERIHYSTFQLTKIVREGSPLKLDVRTTLSVPTHRPADVLRSAENRLSVFASFSAETHTGGLFNKIRQEIKFPAGFIKLNTLTRKI